MAGEAMQLVADAESETDLSNVLAEFQGKADTAFNNLQTLSQDEATLVNDINTYCGAEVPAEGGAAPADGGESGGEETPAAPTDE